MEKGRYYSKRLVPPNTFTALKIHSALVTTVETEYLTLTELLISLFYFTEC